MHYRFTADSHRPMQGKANLIPLLTKMDELFKGCFELYTFPDLQKKLEKFSPAVANPAAQLLLKRGRKWVTSDFSVLSMFLTVFGSQAC